MKTVNKVLSMAMIVSGGASPGAGVPVVLFIRWVLFDYLQFNKQKMMDDTFRAWYEEQKLIDFIELKELEGGKVERNTDEIPVYGRANNSLNVNDITIGDKVHVKNLNGMFEVFSLSRTGFVVTCKTWQDKRLRGDMPYERKHVFYSDFIRFAGGRNNNHKK